MDYDKLQTNFLVLESRSIWDIKNIIEHKQNTDFKQKNNTFIDNIALKDEINPLKTLRNTTG